MKSNTELETWWESPEKLTHEECARFLGIDPRSLSSALSRGHYKFTRYRIGRRNYFRKSEVLAEIEQNHAV
ncbi:MAG: helix-turn-helix domain-containing protein [Candidatus Thiodiazotropha sp.]